MDSLCQCGSYFLLIFFCLQKFCLFRIREKSALRYDQDALTPLQQIVAGVSLDFPRPFHLEHHIQSFLENRGQFFSLR